MYSDICESLRACAEQSVAQCQNCHEVHIPGAKCSVDLMRKAADAIEELTAFAHYVAKKAFDEEWELDPAFCELVCRKLNKIGIVERDGEFWSYEPPKED